MSALFLIVSSFLLCALTSAVPTAPIVKRSPDGGQIAKRSPDGGSIVKRSSLIYDSTHDLDIKFLADKVLVPAGTDAVAWCRIFKLPTTLVPHQMIKYSAIIAPGEDEFVDRIAIWRCNKNMEEYVDKQVKCTEDGIANEMRRSCVQANEMIALQSTGEEGVTEFKADTAFALTEPGLDQYVMGRIVYRNPTDKDLLGESGMQFTLSPSLRPIESGALRVVTLNTRPYFVIPPRMKSYVQSAACIPQCTKDFNGEGINIYGAMPYTHTAVTGLKLRHFRDGAELDPIVNIENHDGKHQKRVNLETERKVLPNDALVLECMYNTEDRTEPSFGGYLLSKEEFCSLNLLYYPKTFGDVHTCTASPESRFYAEALNTHDIQITDETVTVKRNSDNSEIPFAEAAKEYKWSESDNTQKFIDIISKAKYTAGCVNRVVKDGSVIINKVVTHDQDWWTLQKPVAA